MHVSWPAAVHWLSKIILISIATVLKVFVMSVEVHVLYIIIEVVTGGGCHENHEGSVRGKRRHTKAASPRR